MESLTGWLWKNVISLFTFEIWSYTADTDQLEYFLSTGPVFFVENTTWSWNVYLTPINTDNHSYWCLPCGIFIFWIKELQEAKASSSWPYRKITLVQIDALSNSTIPKGQFYEIKKISMRQTSSRIGCLDTRSPDARTQDNPKNWNIVDLWFWKQGIISKHVTGLCD